MIRFNEDYDKYGDREKYVRTQFSDKAHRLSYLLAVLGQNNVYASFEAIRETEIKWHKHRDCAIQNESSKKGFIFKLK